MKNDKPVHLPVSESRGLCISQVSFWPSDFAFRICISLVNKFSNYNTITVDTCDRIFPRKWLVFLINTVNMHLFQIFNGFLLQSSHYSRRLIFCFRCTASGTRSPNGFR